MKSTCPVAIAAFRMLGNLAVAGDWSKVMPPAAQTAETLTASSSLLPDKITARQNDGDRLVLLIVCQELEKQIHGFQPPLNLVTRSELQPPLGDHHLYVQRDHIHPVRFHHLPVLCRFHKVCSAQHNLKAQTVSLYLISYAADQGAYFFDQHCAPICVFF